MLNVLSHRSQRHVTEPTPVEGSYGLAVHVEADEEVTSRWWFCISDDY